MEGNLYFLIYKSGLYYFCDDNDKLYTVEYENIKDRSKYKIVNDNDASRILVDKDK